MTNVLFLDIEADRDRESVYEYGVVCRDRTLKDSSPKAIKNFLLLCQNVTYVCGHNILRHDLPRLKNISLGRSLDALLPIDTLPLSLLLFNEKTFHALPKKYKNEDFSVNDPVEDCLLTKQLLQMIVERFNQLERTFQSLIYLLLKETETFKGFFHYLEKDMSNIFMNQDELKSTILSLFGDKIEREAFLDEMITQHPEELAYILSTFSQETEPKALPPKVLYDYPHIMTYQQRLCYDENKSLQELEKIAKETFGFGSFRFFPKVNPSLLGSSTISQRDIVEAALRDESFLAVLPTGGGKTFTFWLPAIIKASRSKSLTVVVSPLQALIEDHINNFNAKVANYKAVAISGFMSPLERLAAIEQVADGGADLLYIAPESLRSKTIFGLLKNRYIERFVIDEAHCLSTWGNDFRQDYYYICNFVTDLLKEKPFQQHIPISCFTATAKQGVIDDIVGYFHEGIGIELEKYLAVPERKNLRYEAINTPGKSAKYLELLKRIEGHEGASLVYIPTSTRKCDEIAEQLTIDTGRHVRSFHSKIDSQEKRDILAGYLLGEIEVIVATTAFGMGVDKADITQVIHYEPSDSLESYAQEAGRGARDTQLEATCPLLYDERDLDRHFQALTRSKITLPEINSVFRALKRHRGDEIFMTELEIAQEAGWDVEDALGDVSTKIKTILLELEREGYIKRGRNKTRFYGDSIASDSWERLREEMERSGYDEAKRQTYEMVFHQMIGRGKPDAVYLDEISLVLGIGHGEVSEAIETFKEMGIIGSDKEISLEIPPKANEQLEQIIVIEQELFDFLDQWPEQKIRIKELNEHIVTHVNAHKNASEIIRELLRAWRKADLFSFRRVSRQKDLWSYEIHKHDVLERGLKRRHDLARKLMEYFLSKLLPNDSGTVAVALYELRQVFDEKFSLKEIDRTLLYLHRNHIVRLSGGRFISYAPMRIMRLDKMKIRNKLYTKSDYKKRLSKHYQTKTEAIHIMGIYAHFLLEETQKAQRFLKDYFTLPYGKFKSRYKLLKEKISRPITQYRYDKIYAKLSNEQKMIIEDAHTQAMMILAGPGSGKTKVLVHKIASLLLAEDIKPEHFIMLTFTRSAVAEFRRRLYQLIGETAYEVEISTFHAYAYKLIGRTYASDEHQPLLDAVRQIEKEEIHLPHRQVLILDEYQDIVPDAFALVEAMYRFQPDMRIIAVGDDDQYILEFAGARLELFDRFSQTFGHQEDGKHSYRLYALTKNYRSDQAIVGYSNDAIMRLSHRLKNQRLTAVSDASGRVTVQLCSSDNLVQSAFEWIKQKEKIENCAILMHTNDEVLRAYSLLTESGILAKYLIDRERFELKHIEEIVALDRIIQQNLSAGGKLTHEHFERALSTIESQFSGSRNLKLVHWVVQVFLDEERESLSQWLAFLNEVVLEDFSSTGTAITVATIHKSKGMEFDTVLLVEKDMPHTDEEIRRSYVGMTRAKKELIVFRSQAQHHPAHKSPHATYVYDSRHYKTVPRVVTLVMGLDGINLGFDQGVQNHSRISVRVQAGDAVTFHARKTYAIQHSSGIIGYTSRAFAEQLRSYELQGYKIELGTIDYMVCWHDTKHDRYLKHPLCTLLLRRV